jgi:hypothetical protein
MFKIIICSFVVLFWMVKPGLSQIVSPVYSEEAKIPAKQKIVLHSLALGLGGKTSFSLNYDYMVKRQKISFGFQAGLGSGLTLDHLPYDKVLYSIESSVTMYLLYGVKAHTFGIGATTRYQIIKNEYVDNTVLVAGNPSFVIQTIERFISDPLLFAAIYRFQPADSPIYLQFKLQFPVYFSMQAILDGYDRYYYRLHDYFYPELQFGWSFRRKMKDKDGKVIYF